MPEKRSEMMLAMRVNRYLPDDNQLVVAFASICKSFEYSGRILLIASGPMRPGTGNAVGGFDQPLAVRIFPDRAQQSLPVGYAEF
jgi:hypothetical protein